jgi:hypothetical protein
MNALTLINALNDGSYTTITFNGDKKRLAEISVVEFENNIIIPAECINDWPEPRTANKEQLLIIIKILLNGINIIKENMENCHKLLSVNWPNLNNIIKTILNKSQINTLEELKTTLQITNNLNDINYENILKYTNKEIFDFLKDKINDNDIYKFLSNIKRENPNIENTFTESDNINVIKNYNKHYDNIVEKLNNALDAKNAVLSGGSVYDAITGEFSEGRDIDIFCTSSGYINCFNKIKQHYTKIVYFIENSSCINVIIPKINITIQFIICDNPIAWIIGDKNNIGFDFDHLKSIIINNKFYLSFNTTHCLNNNKTYISSDIKGCVLPHRLNKALKRLPVDTSDVLLEYSGQLVDKYLIRNEKYIILNDESDRRIEFLIRKIYGIRENVYIINGDITSIINNSSIAFKENKEVEIENIKKFKLIVDKVITTEKLTVNNNNNNDNNNNNNNNNNNINNDTKNETYTNNRMVFNANRYNNGSGLIPPTVVIGVKTVKDIEYTIIRKFTPGPIIDKIFGGDEYLCFESDKFRKGNVLYISIEKITKQNISYYYNDTHYLCKIIKINSVYRYRDLEEFTNNQGDN